MRHSRFLLLGLPAILAYAAEITFCNELDLGQPCITETIDWDVDQCKLIPDSNAKGDNGSSLQVRLH